MKYLKIMMLGEMVEEQVQLAQKYGIYGFCFYHYWFAGKKVLYKPLEQMLHNRNIQFPYCLAWANEAWTKTWHGAAGTKEVLLRQTYGLKDDWKLHYEYLRQYFWDCSYMKVDNKPMLLIYKIQHMRHRSDMFEYWNQLAKEDGFDGIYLVQMLSDEQPASKLRWINATVDLDPARIRNILRKNRPSAYVKKCALSDKHPKWNWWNRWICDVLDYDSVNQDLLQIAHQKNQFRCCFVDYDDSPRRGKKALIFKGANPKKFGYYLRKQIECAEKEGNEFLFINAWNEWGEGNYLEPDTKYEYQYLEQVQSALKISSMK